MSAKEEGRTIDQSANNSPQSQIGAAYHSSRTARLAALGAWATVFDLARMLLEASASLLRQAEDRGRRVEDDLLKRTHYMETRTAQEMKGWSGRVQHNVNDVRHSVEEELRKSSQAAEDEIERQVKIVLARLGIPGRDRLDKLGAEIDAMTALIDQRLVTSNMRLARMLPVEDYDQLSVTQLLDRLDELDVEELNAIRAYEKNNAGRITLLRALDRRIGAFGARSRA